MICIGRHKCPNFGRLSTGSMRNVLYHLTTLLLALNPFAAFDGVGMFWSRESNPFSTEVLAQTKQSIIKTSHNPQKNRQCANRKSAFQACVIVHACIGFCLSVLVRL